MEDRHRHRRFLRPGGGLCPPAGRAGGPGRDLGRGPAGGADGDPGQGAVHPHARRGAGPDEIGEHRAAAGHAEGDGGRRAGAGELRRLRQVRHLCRHDSPGDGGHDRPQLQGRRGPHRRGHPPHGPGGRILEICSSAAFQPLPAFNVYAATKAFLLRYSRALRWEVAPRGIRVTAVCPGWIKTEFISVAQDTKNGKTVRFFPFALRPETVARRALRDSHVLAVTTCGLPALVQRVASKFLPHCLIMACWEGLRRI